MSLGYSMFNNTLSISRHASSLCHGVNPMQHAPQMSLLHLSLQSCAQFGRQATCQGYLQCLSFSIIWIEEKLILMKETGYGEAMSALLVELSASLTEQKIASVEQTTVRPRR